MSSSSESSNAPGSQGPSALAPGVCATTCATAGVRNVFTQEDESPFGVHCSSYFATTDAFVPGESAASSSFVDKSPFYSSSVSPSLSSGNDVTVRSTSYGLLCADPDSSKRTATPPIVSASIASQIQEILRTCGPRLRRNADHFIRCILKTGVWGRFKDSKFLIYEENKQQKALFIRPSYVDIFQIIRGLWNGIKPTSMDVQHCALITGTPGVGKSVFGTVLCKTLNEQSKPTLIFYGESGFPLTLFWQGNAFEIDDDRDAVDLIRRIISSGLYSKTSHEDDKIEIWSIGDTCIPLTHASVNRICITSPGDARAGGNFSHFVDDEFRQMRIIDAMRYLGTYNLDHQHHSGKLFHLFPCFKFIPEDEYNQLTLLERYSSTKAKFYWATEAMERKAWAHFRRQQESDVLDYILACCSASCRPIIFVAHSLGGLVCKKAILLSRNNREAHLRSIFDWTRGIIFMGTPHMGSWMADWAKISASALGLVTSTNKSLLQILQPDDELNSIAFSHDDKHLASASSDKTIKIWVAASGKCLQKLEDHSHWFNSVAFSHNDKHLASASYDKTVKIWAAASGKRLQTLKGHSREVHSVAFSHDDKRLASASSTIKIWDAASGKLLQMLKGHRKAVMSVAFSHDDKCLASASWDETVKIWDAASGKCLQKLKGHRKVVRSVEFSHDNKHLASSSDDETVKIWNAASGKCLQTLEVSTTLRNISFDPTVQCLRTEIGAIILDVLSASSTALSTIAYQKPRCQGHGISSDGIWITCNSENLLWLPSEYRPLRSAVTASTVAIGCSSGRVLIFNFTNHNSLGNSDDTSDD